MTDYNSVRTMDKADAEAAGLYVTIGQAVDDAYIAELKKQVKHYDSIEAVGDQVKDRVYAAAWYR